MPDKSAKPYCFTKKRMVVEKIDLVSPWHVIFDRIIFGLVAWLNF